MIRPALTLALLLGAAPAAAEATPPGAPALMVADCTDRGCRCSPSAVTLSEAEVLLAQPAPPGTVTLVRLNGSYIWSPYSPADIDLIAGGDGSCQADLTPPLLPADGQWVGRIRERSVTQCPAGLDRALESLSEAMVFPRDVRWQGKFHPDKLRLEGSAAAIRWEELSPTRFSGTGPAAGSSRATSLVKMSVTYDAELTAADQIDLVVALSVRAQGVSQAVIDAAGLGKCDVRVEVDIRRTGP